MTNSKVDYSVVLPVCTKPSQFNTINDFAISLKAYDKLIPFAGIHPMNENIGKKLEWIKSQGFPGIKLHPDYQGSPIDSPKFIALIKKAISLDLIILIHSGIDVGKPDSIYCSPKRFLNVLDALTYDEYLNNKIVLAHTGGWKLWEDVATLLVGKNVYFDLSYSMGFIDDSLLVSMIKEHGTDKILFATDSPWQDPSYVIKHLQSLPLTKDDIDAILSGNAVKLLGL